MKFGIIGSGSWGTALAKMLSDNGNAITWWNRSQDAIDSFKINSHNPQYLQAAKFDMSMLTLTTDVNEVVAQSDCIIIAIPSAYIIEVLSRFSSNCLQGKTIVSAVKGLLPQKDILLNEYLQQDFSFPIEKYMAVLGPCHAEEVASEQLSYLTFSGTDLPATTEVASYFKSRYCNIIVNPDIYGVQYAAVLKNIYALGAGIAHGLGYGDNFLSVFIANAADEMAGFLRKAGIINAEVGYIESEKTSPQKHQNYAASVYLGDLLVTCYSLHSRNRAFGNMIGKGYSIKAAQLEMNMVAEGYFASRCMHNINEKVGAQMPIANAVYSILWEGKLVREAYTEIEKLLI